MLKPKDEYLQPTQGPNGRWRYGFDALDVGAQMRCALEPEEKHPLAQARVLSAAASWRSKRTRPERSRMRSKTCMRNSYILLERVA